MPDQTLPARAVFLSYASEDVDAATRICEALRAAGVEVWFDRDELRGGDAWDSKIKKQIHDCALFIPLISVQTNARTEGYFRREWKLATRRLLDIADDAALLVPVVIDDTREANARVPEEFLGVQWTRLPGGETPPAFAKRVRQLLGMDTVPIPTAKAAAGVGIERSSRNPGSVQPRSLPLVRRFAIPLIALLMVLSGGAFWYFQRASNAPSATPAPATAMSVVPVASDDKSIAVLPFVDMSAEKNQEYMSDGIAEELLNLLAQVPDLKVIARTSSFAFKGQNIDIAEIAKKLNVTHVLEGSVRTSGNQMRITAQLVRAADRTHLWSDRYDRPMDDIFAVQDEIANAVVSELRIELLGAAPKAKHKDPRAYALFLQARDVGYQATPSALELAMSLYRQALALDPAYAEAWDGLAYIYGSQAIQGLRSSAEAFGLAFEAANKALEVDPQYAQAHARLGWIAIFYDRDYEMAARHLSRAMALDSSSADILFVAGILSRRLGRMEQAIDFGKRAIARDPVNAEAHFELANSHKYAKQWDAAIQQWRTVLTLSPSALGARGSVGEVLVLQGHAESALAEIQLEADDAWRLGVKSIAHHALGQSAESEAAFAELSKKHSRLYSYTVAEVAAYRGDADYAFDWLEKAAQLHDPVFGITPFDPFLKNLHDDPRWLPFLQKHGLAPEQLAAIKFDAKLPVEATAQ